MRTQSITAVALAAVPMLGLSAAPTVAADAATHRRDVRPVVSPRFAGGSGGQASTPNGCIVLNGGDYNACSVGNSGRGDLPYKIALHRTPNECILLNGGDYNACNVGNSGRGDLPYGRVRTH